MPKRGKKLYPKPRYPKHKWVRHYFLSAFFFLLYILFFHKAVIKLTVGFYIWLLNSILIPEFVFILSGHS